jgi:hypothetical protein
MERIAEKVEPPGRVLTFLIEDIRLDNIEMEDLARDYNLYLSQSNHKLDEIKKYTLKVIATAQKILPVIEGLKKHRYITY